VLKESTGALIAELVTDANGQYSLLMATQDPVILLAKPPAGYQPLAHGPINPSLRNQS
jgi:glutamine phosphoribosylpyrophosphate amidotransferase